MAETVLITGASRGIGAETARRFAQAGYRVAINYCRSAQRAEALAAEINAGGGTALAVQADVADGSQVREMFRQVRQRLGFVSALVHNAGIARQQLFIDVSEAEWNRLFAVHVNGAFHCCQCALPEMLSRRRGSIVMVSSIWGLVGASCEAPYSAAKAALIGLTKALAKEAGPSGVRVNCVAPGVIDTEMNAALDEAARAALREETPLGALGAPADVAEAIFYLASPQARFVTGQVLSPNGGIVI